jgi:amidase
MEKVINEKLLEPWTLGLGKWFDSRPENQVKKAVNLLKNDTIKTKGFFEEYDMLLTPVMQTTVPKLGFLAPSVDYDDLLQRCIDIISITPLANVTGEPAISLPLHWSTIGLPIGSHFQAGIGKEKELLQLALDLEEAKPWKNRRPI